MYVKEEEEDYINSFALLALVVVSFVPLAAHDDVVWIRFVREAQSGWLCTAVEGEQVSKQALGY